MAPPAVPAPAAVILRPRVDGIPVPHFRSLSQTKRPKEDGKNKDAEPKRNAAGVLMKKMPTSARARATKIKAEAEGEEAKAAKAKAGVAEESSDSSKPVQVKKMPMLPMPEGRLKVRARSPSSSSSSSFRVETVRPRPRTPVGTVARAARAAPWPPPEMRMPDLPEPEMVCCECCGKRFTVEEWELSWTWELS